MNNKQHVQLTKVTDYDFVSAEKDKYGVFYSRDGLRLIDVDNKTFSCREYRIKESVKIIWSCWGFLIFEMVFYLTKTNKAKS